MADEKKRTDGTDGKKKFRIGGQTGTGSSGNLGGSGNSAASNKTGAQHASAAQHSPDGRSSGSPDARGKTNAHGGKPANGEDKRKKPDKRGGRTDKAAAADKRGAGGNAGKTAGSTAGNSAGGNSSSGTGGADSKKSSSAIQATADSSEREKQKKSGLIRRSLVATLEREAEQQREAALAGLSPYYIKISSRFRLAKIITAITLAVFIVVMLSVFRSDITPENIRYMIRDLGVTNTVYSNTSSVTITYESDTSSVFGLFRDSLAKSDGSGFHLYSREGGNIFSEEHSYETPSLSVSDSYAVTYDLGGTSYAVYNSLGRISGGTTAYPIYMAAASDSGSYAVLTRSAEYRTVAYIYDGSGKNTAQIFKDKYAVSAGFSSGGSLFYITSIDERDGSLSGEISVYDPRGGSTVYTVDTGTAVVADAYFDGSTLTAITSRSLLRISPSGGMTAEYGYGSFVPSTWCFGDGYSVIGVTSEKVSGQSDIIVLGDTLGEEQRVAVTGEVKRLCSSGDYVYALLSGSVLRLDVRSGETAEYSYEGSPCDIHVGNGTLWLCYYSQSTALSEAEAFSAGD